MARQLDEEGNFVQYSAKLTAEQIKQQKLREYYGNYKDTSLLEPRDAWLPFLYYNAPWHLTSKNYNPQYSFNAIPKVEHKIFSKPIEKEGPLIKYDAFCLYALKENHDLLYRRISYLQSYWKDQGLFDHAFNVTPLNIYGEERKIGEISLGLICADKQSREVAEIVAELQKINPDITTYPVIRDLNGKPVDMTEIDFKCINVGIKKVDTAIDYYYKVFKQYRALAKQFISITDGKIESHLLQSNGDTLNIKHSHANYFTVPNTRHMVSELVDYDCSAQTKTRMIAQKAVKTAVATNSGISETEKNSPFSL